MNYKIFLSVFIILALIINEFYYAQNKRAMWVWNSSNEVNNIVNNIGEYRKLLFEFCNSPHGNPQKKITHLFLGCSGAIYSYQNMLRNFLSEASDSGISVEYLDGDPSWATYKQTNGIERINKIVEFNENSTSDKEKFKGIQFDVEPYLLIKERGYQSPYWDVEKMSVWNSYVNYVDSCKKIIENSDSSLLFGIAIPRWYENQVGLVELERLQEKVDYVAIMDYNENAVVIINDAENEIKNAGVLNKKVWIGVETQEISPETVSFFEEGNSFMESQLDSTFSVYGNNEIFLGFAIHAYKYYRNLNENPTSVDYTNNFEKTNNFILFQNYPNPFNPSTTIKYTIMGEVNIQKTKVSKVVLKIYDALGNEIVTLINQYKNPGTYEINFDAGNLTSGVYFYRLQVANYISTKKMFLIK